MLRKRKVGCRDPMIRCGTFAWILLNGPTGVSSAYSAFLIELCLGTRQ